MQVASTESRQRVDDMQQHAEGNRYTLRSVWTALVASAFVWVSCGALAADTGQTKTVGGLTVYIGVMPAEIVKGHPLAHPEAQMHGGAPTGSHEYHVVAAVFDTASGARITDARVSGRVAGIALAGSWKVLEAMTIASAGTYGNYFDLSDTGALTISLRIERAGAVVGMDFPYRHS